MNLCLASVLGLSSEWSLQNTCIYIIIFPCFPIFCNSTPPCQELVFFLGGGVGGIYTIFICSHGHEEKKQKMWEGVFFFLDSTDVCIYVYIY